jgi:di/tricarboxylate transporter
MDRLDGTGRSQFSRGRPRPRLLGMIWTFSAGGKLFAYQSGVLIVGYSYGYFAARDLVRMGACLTVVEFLALLLLVPFYWPLILNRLLKNHFGGHQ